MIPECKPPAEPVPPQLPTPPLACDTHAHVFGPADRFPYTEERSYTPPDAPLEKYIAMLDTLGFARGVLVQGSAHGRDNSAMLDGLLKYPERLRGVIVADSALTNLQMLRLHAVGVRGLRFNHFFRHGKLHYGGGVALTEAENLALRLKALRWHIQLWIDVNDLPTVEPLIRALGVPVVVDHMGRTDAHDGIDMPGFQCLLRLLGEGLCWVKLSGAHRLCDDWPDYIPARPFHEALVRTNPEQLIWGTDWPHPRIEVEMPNAGHLLDLFNKWTPDEALRHKILVDNPAKLYDFPAA
jgi:predicted TIM-barrel fold metal-dependent hydrolase